MTNTITECQAQPSTASKDGDSTTSLSTPFQYITSFSEEIISDAQPESPLVQLETVSASCHSLPGRRDQPSWTVSFQVAGNSDKISFPSFLFPKIKPAPSATPHRT